MIQLRSLTLSLPMILLAVWGAKSVNAQDRIWIEPRSPTNQRDWYPATVQVIDAKILGFDAKQLRCKIPEVDQEQSFASIQVMWIEPIARPEIQRRTIELFNNNQYGDALKLLPELLQQRPAIWHQQWLTMMAAVAASRSNQPKLALELVAQLDRRPLPPMVVAWTPIQWQNQRSAPDAVAQATDRLQDQSELVQLTAASWLLSSPKRSDALRMLAKLQNSKRMDVKPIAEFLTWRAATPPETKRSADQWQQRVDRLPLVLQTGPTKTLIDKFNSAGLSERAKHLQLSLDVTPIAPNP